MELYFTRRPAYVNNSLAQTRPTMVPKRPNIFDLEKASGFSGSTISRAFRPNSIIKPATRERILRAAAEIGYSPHPGARMIRAQRMNRWGLLLPNLQNPFYSEIVEACDQEARRRGTSLILGLSHYDEVLTGDLLQQWAGGETDGLIVDSPQWDKNGPLLEKLRARSFPIVCLHSIRPQFHMVQMQIEPSLVLAMEQLVSFGHRRIAYLGYEGSHPNASHTAYESTLRRHGLPIRNDYLFFGSSFGRQEGFKAWQKWKALPERPTAVLAFNDVLACSLWRAVQIDGLSVPRDLSIIGNDDIAESSLIGLTTIRGDHPSLAREILDVLESARRDPSLPPQRRIIPTDFISRTSVAVPPPESPTL